MSLSRGFDTVVFATAGISLLLMTMLPSAIGKIHEIKVGVEEETGRDGARMVRIPAGRFSMGNEFGTKDERPVHEVAISAFYLDKYEVTNEQFSRFVLKMSYQIPPGSSVFDPEPRDDNRPPGWKSRDPGASWMKPDGRSTIAELNRWDHPVVAVSWNDADRYCSAYGKRLPTEAEWEYAVRAGSTKVYWWGDEIPRFRKIGNLADASLRDAVPEFAMWGLLGRYRDGYERTAPVGSFQANRWGLHDMTGNVWEWVADWYDPSAYHARTGVTENPSGPRDDAPLAKLRGRRGGSWSSFEQYAASAIETGCTLMCEAMTSDFAAHSQSRW